MTTRQEVVEYLKTLSVEEVESLLSEVLSIDEGFPGGVKLENAYAMVGVAYGVLTPSDEKDYSFDLYLTESGPNRIQCMRLIRGLTGWTLAEAKVAVDKGSLITPLLKEVFEGEAKEIVAKFKAIGATVTLQGSDTRKWY